MGRAELYNMSSTRLALVKFARTRCTRRHPNGLRAFASGVPPPQGIISGSGNHGHQGGRSKQKIRQHVNPQTLQHQKLLELPRRWPEQFFKNPGQPLHIDVGSARGLFALDLAAAQPGLNVLGLEIRAPFAHAAAADAQKYELGNAAFMACNANVNLEPILRLTDDCAELRSVSIQFPDPWFKNRHKKRRVLQPALVATIAHYLSPGGWLFFQTDVLECAEEMRDVIQATAPMLKEMCTNDDGWSTEKPSELVHVSTERERASYHMDRPVYM